MWEKIDLYMVSAPCRARDFELERYIGGSLGAGNDTLAGQKFPFLPPPPPPVVFGR